MSNYDHPADVFVDAAEALARADAHADHADAVATYNWREGREWRATEVNGVTLGEWEQVAKNVAAQYSRDYDHWYDEMPLNAPAPRGPYVSR